MLVVVALKLLQLALSKIRVSVELSRVELSRAVVGVFGRQAVTDRQTEEESNEEMKKKVAD